MTKINLEFAEHTTSVAFQLTLSKSMIVKLVEIATRRPNDNSLFLVLGLSDRAVMAGRALRDRGLVVAPDPEWQGQYELTEAGEHLFALLQIAGLVQRIDDQLATKAA